ncbi:hypothetical protein NPIL_73571 [Nephila pilipes]|uniref:Uncharacterized protein n=1 Tax=Nephila pilipes TaxID=299642 RepID=A0A8X6TVG1_NEPPI|nr:hypothetical protein NPIL_73571 [Nephila pilipes]
MTLDVSEFVQQTSSRWDPQSFASHDRVCLNFTLLAVKMLSSKIEQNVNLKFLVKLNKTPAECLHIISHRFMEKTMPLTGVLSVTKGSLKAMRKWKTTNALGVEQLRETKKRTSTGEQDSETALLQRSLIKLRRRIW